MQFDSTTINMLIKGIGETFYMVLLSSALSYIIGIPLGIALVVTDKDGISPVPVFNRVLGVDGGVFPEGSGCRRHRGSQVHGGVHLADYREGPAA